MLAPLVAWAQSEFRSGHFLTSDGVQLHFLEAGSGPAIVFTPGFTAPAVVVAWSLGVLETLTYAREFGTDPFRGVVLVDMFLGVDEELGEPHPYEAGWRTWITGDS